MRDVGAVGGGFAAGAAIDEHIDVDGPGEDGISAAVKFIFGCLERNGANENVRRIASKILIGFFIFDRISSLTNV
jgi:hypothetical protein